MKKLLGIMAVLALLAVPGIAAEQEATVNITVDAYGLIGDISSLALTVTGPWLDGAGSPCTPGSSDFLVLCNTDSTLKLTAAVVTEASAAPGSGLYPTAAGTGEAEGHSIGFGLTLANLSTPQSCPWPDGIVVEANAFVSVTFSGADVPADYSTHNARISIFGYTDSARGTDKLAPPGPYTTTLTLTLQPGV